MSLMRNEPHKLPNVYFIAWASKQNLRPGRGLKQKQEKKKNQRVLSAPCSAPATTEQPKQTGAQQRRGSSLLATEPSLLKDSVSPPGSLSRSHRAPALLAQAVPRGTGFRRPQRSFAL